MEKLSLRHDTSDNPNYWRLSAWILWILPLLAITGFVLVAPLERSMTPSYHAAVANWWAHQPVYTGPAGFNYLPAFLLGFSLVHWLPLSASEILWRWLALAGLGCGLWAGAGVITSSRNRYKNFVIVTLIVLPICVSALRNGQSSAHLAACLVFATWSLHRQQWWRATLWLCLSLVCKPLGIVAIGLAGVAFPPMRVRALLGVLIVLGCPFLFAPALYVNEIYFSFFKNIIDCFDTGDRTFADINGVLMACGIILKGMPSLYLRLIAAAVTVTFSFLLNEYGTDIRRPLFWLAFTTSYIMLFTPMNEANSYVMFAPCLGLWALWYREQQSLLAFKMIVAMAWSILLLSDLVGLMFGKYSGNQFAKVWNPLMTLVFIELLLVSPQSRYVAERIFLWMKNPLRQNYTLAQLEKSAD